MKQLSYLMAIYWFIKMYIWPSPSVKFFTLVSINN